MAQSKTINMTAGSNRFELWFSQGDIGVTREVSLTQKGDYFEVPSGAEVRIVGTKPSGFGFNEEVTYDGHVVTITSTLEMTDEVGYIECEIRITKDGLRQGSVNGHLGIEKDPHPDGTVDGSAGEVIPELTRIMEQIHEDVSKAEVLQESEAWAVGQRDGVDVDEDDPTYHNNSKYYATGAAHSADLASGYEASAKEHKDDTQAALAEARLKLAAMEADLAAAIAAKEDAEAAAEAAAHSVTVEGNCSISILPTGQIREVWTTED